MCGGGKCKHFLFCPPYRKNFKLKQQTLTPQCHTFFTFRPSYSNHIMGKFFLFLAANHAAILIYASLTEDEQKGCTERTVTGTEVANGYLLTPRQQHMNYCLWFLLQVHYKLWQCRISWQNVENYSSGTLKQKYISYPIQILYDTDANGVDTSLILIFVFSK